MKKIKLLFLMLLPLMAFAQTPTIYKLPFDTVKIMKQLLMPAYSAGIVEVDGSGHAVTVPVSTFVTPSSTNTLTNKSGNISQWTNDVGYITSVLPKNGLQSVSGGLGLGGTLTFPTTVTVGSGTSMSIVDINGAGITVSASGTPTTQLYRATSDGTKYGKLQLTNSQIVIGSYVFTGGKNKSFTMDASDLTNGIVIRDDVTLKDPVAAANYAATMSSLSYLTKHEADSLYTAALGFTPESVANKTATASASTANYPNWLGVENYAQPLLTVSNGLTLTGAALKLGGTLAGATAIDPNGNVFKISGVGVFGNDQASIDQNGSVSAMRANNTTTHVEADVETLFDTSLLPYAILQVSDGTKTQGIQTKTTGKNGIRVQDQFSHIGLHADSLSIYPLKVASSPWNYLIKKVADSLYASAGSGAVSVFGRTGAVVAASGDYNTSQVTENTNLYWTTARGDARYPQLTGSYVNPAWITSLPWSKITGAPTNVSSFTNDAGYTTGASTTVFTNKDLTSGTNTFPTFNQSTTGNAATVTNGVYTTGSYVNPAWITSLPWSKITGAPTNVSSFTNDAGYTTGASTTVFTNKDLTSGTNTFPTFNQNTTGSAAKLTTVRTINGTNFDGTANITITANVPNNLTFNYGFTPTGSFNGGSAVGVSVDSTKLVTQVALLDSLNAHGATIGYGLTNVSNVLSADSTLLGSKTWAFAAFYTKNQILSNAFTITGLRTYNNTLTTSGGVGYGQIFNPAITFSASNDVSAGLSVTPTYSSFGAIATTSTTNGGSSYTNGSYTSVPITYAAGATVQTGSGATANVTVSGGAITAITIVSGGTNYSASDGLTIAAASIGGTGSGLAFKGATFTNQFSNLTALRAAYSNIPAPSLSGSFNAVSAVNTFTAASGNNQNSPNYHFRTNAWNTTAVASQPVDAWMALQPLQGSSISSQLLFYFASNSGAPSIQYTFGSGGSATWANQTLNTIGIATTSTSALKLQNTTAATSGVPVQYTPSMLWTGNAWTGSASQAYGWRTEGRGVNGTNPITSAWYLSSSINGGSYLDVLKVDNTGLLSTVHVTSSTSAPSIAAGTGAGTSPTVSILANSNDLDGVISVTTGTTPAGSNAVVATITFNTAYGIAPKVVINESNTNAQSLTGGTTKVIVPAAGETNGTTTTTFVIQSGTTALTASTNYKWSYHVIQ